VKIVLETVAHEREQFHENYHEDELFIDLLTMKKYIIEGNIYLFFVENSARNSFKLQLQF